MGDLTDSPSSIAVSPLGSGVEGLLPVSSPATKLIPKELFLFQKLPLFLLVRLDCEPESALSAPGDAGRNPGESGDALS